MKKKSNTPKANNTDTLLKLYQIYDGNRDAILWFLEGLYASDYKEYLEKYPRASSERSHFIACILIYSIPLLFGIKPNQ